jgi:hypothetical protein
MTEYQRKGECPGCGNEWLERADLPPKERDKCPYCIPDSKGLPICKIGTRVIHRRRGLKGTVGAIQYHETGRLSPIPYLIDWDDVAAAKYALGGTYFFGNDQSVEAVE